MADRFPLIIDSVDQQIQELSSGDNLDLASSGVVNANLVHSSGVNVGVVTATKFKGDGSELENLPASGGTFEATATGTLADGSKVIVNADGTVSVVAQDETTGPGVGSAFVYESATSYNHTGTYDSTNDKVIITYVDNGNSNYGTAIVGEIDGTDITFGSETVFEFGNAQELRPVYDSTNGKVVIAYRDAGNSYYGTAVVGEVDPNDNSIDFGTPVIFEYDNVYNISATYDSTNSKVVISYTDYANSNRGTSIVGEVSGNSINFGTPEVFSSSATYNISSAFDSTNSKVVIAYQDNGNSAYGTAIVGEVDPNDNSIDFGTPEVFEYAQPEYNSVTFDSTNSKVVIAYQDTGNSNYGTAIVGEVSGTDITFGTPEVFYYGRANYISAVFDSTNGKVVIAYQDNQNSLGLGKVVSGTVNNTSINFGTTITFYSANTQEPSAIFDSSSGKVVIAYGDNPNSNRGTAVVFAETGFPVPSVGTPDIFNSSTNGSYWTSAVYDSTNNKVVIAYGDGGNSYYGTAIVGEVSGTGITFGTPTVFESGTSQYISVVHDSSNNKIVIAYRNYDSSSVGKAIVGEISENSISFPSSPGTYESDNTAYNSAVYDSANGKVVVAYTDFGDNGYGKARVGEVSGTSISFPSSSTTFKTASQSSPIRYIGITYDSTNDKVVIGYRNDNWYNYGEAIVGEVSGTGISFPSSSVPFNQGDSRYISPVHDSTNGKIVISYTDGMNNYYGTAIVGEVSGTSISFPSPSIVFNSANTWHITAVYDSTNQKVVTAYQNSGNSNYGTAVIGTVSGTGINFDSPVVFESAESQYNSATYDSTNNKVVIAYTDAGNSYRGTAVTFTNRTISNNLTSENFIGISNGAYADGETATIQIAGAVDDAQSGLTPGQQYYVQNDGTLSETAGNPSVLAGTAVAATKLIIG